MFKIAVNEAYWAPVTVSIPSDLDKTDKRKFEVKFRRLGQAELDKISDQVNKGETTDDQVARSVLLDWKGVQDEGGNELPFNEDNLAKLLEVFPVRPSIVAAFFKTINGARQKN